MDKKLLIDVLRNYTANSEQEVADIIALKEKFPFSQTLHVLAARITKDLQSDLQQRALQQAAVYTTDRALLKEIMTMDVRKAIEQHSAPITQEISTTHTTSGESASHSTESSKPVVDEKLVVYQQIESTIDQVDLADAVIHDLRKLSELKHNFELLFTDQSTVSRPDDKPQRTHTESRDTKSKREKIIELAKTVNQGTSASPGSSSKKKRKDAASELIEEIKTSKEEIEPDNERLKEQIEIIDQFIKAQPTISNVRDRNPLPPTDLNSVKSGEFGENIVSETLVEILIKQGKKDRAIEVLKKLIWKYPQKKAYFASQIEDLKK